MSQKKADTELGAGEEVEFQVKDRRHWSPEAEADDSANGESNESANAPAQPTIIDEYRERAEQAEKKLLEYIEAFKQFSEEQDRVRVRLNRDVDRKVHLQFGELVAELLNSVDGLDRALAHVGESPDALSLAQGVSMVRDQFIDTLVRHGVERMDPDGETFDPNLAEAIRVDAVERAEHDGRVTETLRPGYRLGDRVLRAAQVAVGRFSGGQ